MLIIVAEEKDALQLRKVRQGQTRVNFVSSIGRHSEEFIVAKEYRFDSSLTSITDMRHPSENKLPEEKVAKQSRKFLLSWKTNKIQKNE